MKNLPEYYQLIEQSKHGFINNFTIKTILNDPVNHDLLDKSVQRAIKRFPYFAVKLIPDDKEGIKIVYNSAPVKVIKRGSTSLILGNESSNNHLLTVEYDNKDIYFSINHALTGAWGLTNFIKTVLYLYCSKKYSAVFNKDSFMLPGEEIKAEERAYPDKDYLNSLSFEPLRDQKPGFTLVNDLIEANKNPELKQDCYYQIKLKKEEVMSFSKSSDSSPCSAVAMLLFKALSRIVSQKDQEFNCLITHNCKNEAGCSDSSENIIRDTYVHYNHELLSFTDEKLGTVTRGQIINETMAERSVTKLKNDLKNIETIDGFTTFKEKKEFALAHNAMNTKVIPSYVVSYVGNTDWGGLENYIDSVYTISPGHLLFEVNAVGDKILICFNNILKKQDYLNELLNELKYHNLSYDLSGPYNKNIPSIIWE